MKEIFDPQNQIQSIESRIVVALERISEVFRVLLWRETKQSGLSPIQLQILIFLKYHEEPLRTVSHLAQEFNLTRATISDAVKALVNKELLVKVSDKEDARSFHLALSKDGKRIARELNGFAAEIAAPLLEASAPEKKMLLDTLMKMILHFTRAGIIQTQRMCYTCAYHDTERAGGSYCRLLEKPLKREELRLDCPDHVAAGVAG